MWDRIVTIIAFYTILLIQYVACSLAFICVVEIQSDGVRYIVVTESVAEPSILSEVNAEIHCILVLCYMYVVCVCVL